MSKSKIKNIESYLKDSYISVFRLKIEFAIKVNKKLRGGELMLVDYTKEILGVEVL